MIIKILGCIMFAVGAFIMLTQDMGNADIKKLKLGVTLANGGLLILFVALLLEPEFAPMYMTLIVSDIIFFVVDIVILKSMEKQA